MDPQLYIRNVVTLEYDISKCNGCRMCVEVCPHNVFRMTDRRAQIITRDRCMECGACEINCSTEALKVQHGVGCASAVISGFFRRTGPTCDCGQGKAGC